MESVFGGMLIGISVSLMLMFTGRITGISGIVGNLLVVSNENKTWRWVFLSGLIVGGLILKTIRPDVFSLSTSAGSLDYLGAGFLVGFGTLLGNGCTSGHGICGISRFSVRSLLATTTFILSGIVSVLIFRILRGNL